MYLEIGEKRGPAHAKRQMPNGEPRTVNAEPRTPNSKKGLTNLLPNSSLRCRLTQAANVDEKGTYYRNYRPRRLLPGRLAVVKRLRGSWNYPASQHIQHGSH